MTQFCVLAKVPSVASSILEDSVRRAQRLLEMSGSDTKLVSAGRGLPFHISLVSSFEKEKIGLEASFASAVEGIRPFAVSFESIQQGAKHSIHAPVESDCWNTISSLRDILHARLGLPLTKAGYTPGITLARKLSHPRMAPALATLRKTSQRSHDGSPVFPMAFTVSAISVFAQLEDKVWSELFDVALQGHVALT